MSLGTVAVAAGLGQVGITALIGFVITITLSTFLSAQADRLTPILSRPLLPLQQARPRTESVDPGRPCPDVAVIGLGRLGRTLCDELQARGIEVLGVDDNPHVVGRGVEGVPVAFGDLGDPALPQQLPLDGARWIVSTPRELETLG